MKSRFSSKDGEMTVHIYFHLLPKLLGTNNKGLFKLKHKGWGEN